MYTQRLNCYIIPVGYHTIECQSQGRRYFLVGRPGARPTNDISIEFEIRPKFAGLWFKMHSTDHNEILHTSRQCNCRDVCKISLWSVTYILNWSTQNIGRISNSIEISLVGRAPGSICSLQHVDGLVQERRNSSALVMELHLSCAYPSNYLHYIRITHELISCICDTKYVAIFTYLHVDSIRTQCMYLRFIIQWALRGKFHWKCYLIQHYSFKNTFQNVVFRIVAILIRPRSLNELTKWLFLVTLIYGDP